MRTVTKVALHLAQQTIPEKVALARGSVTSMTGNPTYTTPDVPLATMSAAADKAEKAAAKAKNSHDAWLADVSGQHDAEKELDDFLRTQARYVERASGGDETKVKTSGFQVAAVPIKKAGVLPAPTRLTTAHGDHDFEVDLNWDKLTGAVTYKIATALTVEGPFTIVDAVTPSKATLTGITKPVWVQIAGVNANGTGAWCDPVQTG